MYSTDANHKTLLFQKAINIRTLFISRNFSISKNSSRLWNFSDFKNFLNSYELSTSIALSVPLFIVQNLHLGELLSFRKFAHLRKLLHLARPHNTRIRHSWNSHSPTVLRSNCFKFPVINCSHGQSSEKRSTCRISIFRASDSRRTSCPHVGHSSTQIRALCKVSRNSVTGHSVDQRVSSEPKWKASNATV